MGSFEELCAHQEMEAWVRKYYIRLIDFAFLDNESENGYAWPSVEIEYELMAEFLKKYPEKLILIVAKNLESNGGPWGVRYLDM